MLQTRENWFSYKLYFSFYILQTNDADQFIFPEGAGRHRGRFELMFSQIGGSVFAGILY